MCWSGDNFLKAQLHVNQILFEAFRFEPNDFPTTETRLAGVNVDRHHANGLTLGLTWLTAERGELGYGIELDPRSRDDIPQILRGLQHLYTTPDVRAEVFAILEDIRAALAFANALVQEDVNGIHKDQPAGNVSVQDFLKDKSGSECFRSDGA